MWRIPFFFIALYRRFLSPVLPASCRFYPTCSEYSALALRRYGLMRGTALAVRRIVKCHPWNAGGFDPVPGNDLMVATSGEETDG